MSGRRVRDSTTSAPIHLSLARGEGAKIVIHQKAVVGVERARRAPRAARRRLRGRPASRLVAAARVRRRGRAREAPRRRDMPLPLDVTARVAVARAVVAFALAFALVVALVVVARARRVLARANVAAVRWRPKFLWRLYQRSARSLLRRVEDRFSRTARDGGGSGRRAFGAVVGACPFVHVGEAKLARDVLRGTTVKSPLYHAFEAFSGTGIFTAEGEDWEGKRGEVLRAFHAVGLQALRDRAVEESARIVRGMKLELERGGMREMETLALPTLQRLALRVTFGYLTGNSLAEACAEVGRAQADVESEYLAAAPTLRHLIPARAEHLDI